MEVSALLEAIEDETTDFVGTNTPRHLTELRKDLTFFVKCLSKHSRIQASHVLVVMISTETREAKPYALPVQCVPYRGLTDTQLRNLVNTLIREMKQRKMNVSGT